MLKCADSLSTCLHVDRRTRSCKEIEISGGRKRWMKRRRRSSGILFRLLASQGWQISRMRNTKTRNTKWKENLSIFSSLICIAYDVEASLFKAHAFFHGTHVRAFIYDIRVDFRAVTPTYISAKIPGQFDTNTLRKRGNDCAENSLAPSAPRNS